MQVDICDESVGEDGYCVALGAIGAAVDMIGRS